MKVIDFQKHPLNSGLALGLIAWLAVLVSLVALVALMSFVECATGDRGYGDLIGFFALPFLALFAMPWEFVIDGFFKSIFLGLAINFLIVGLVVGIVKKLSTSKQTKVDSKKL